MEVRFLDEDGLRVAGDTAGEGVGKAKGGGEGKTVTASAPPVAAASAAMVARTMFPCGSRFVIMRQAVSAATKAGSRRKPAGLLDTRPHFAQGAELGDGEELILVGRETEEDEAACVVERDAAALQSAQIGHRHGEREGKLLSFRPAGGMDRPPIGERERSAEPLTREIGDEAGDDGSKLAPGPRDAARRHGANGIEAEADVH